MNDASEIEKLRTLLLEAVEAREKSLDVRIADLYVKLDHVENRLSHVHGVINTHNDHYAQMATTMTQLHDQFTHMAQYLETLEQIRAMLNLAKPKE